MKLYRHLDSDRLSTTPIPGVTTKHPVVPLVAIRIPPEQVTLSELVSADAPAETFLQALIHGIRGSDRVGIGERVMWNSGEGDSFTAKHLARAPRRVSSFRLAGDELITIKEYVRRTHRNIRVLSNPRGPLRDLLISLMDNDYGITHAQIDRFIYLAHCLYIRCHLDESESAPAQSQLLLDL